MTRSNAEPALPGATAGSLRIIDVIFTARPPQRRKASWALLVTGAFYAGLWCWANAAASSLEAWSAALAVRVRTELGRQEVVELPPPKPPEPPPPAPPPTLPAPPQRLAPPPHAVSVTKAAPPPARAGRIIAREPKDDAVDLTASTFVTGTASAYAGGTSSASGTSAQPVFAHTPAPASQHSQPDLSHAVSLDENEWRCRWPRAAEAEDIDEQSVVLRVSVRPDGSVASARLLSDPGYGFGAAALVCAARTRFTPARNRQGRAILAESPAIRVRFAR